MYSFQKKWKLIEISRNKSNSKSINKNENLKKIIFSPKNISKKLKIININDNKKLKKNVIKENSLDKINSFSYIKEKDLNINLRGNSGHVNSYYNIDNNISLNQQFKYYFDLIIFSLRFDNIKFFIQKIIFFDEDEVLIKPINLKFKIVNCKLPNNDYSKLFDNDNCTNIEFIKNNTEKIKIYFEFTSQSKINYLKIYNNETYNSIKGLELYLNSNIIFNNELNTKNTIININTYQNIALKKYYSDNKAIKKDKIFKLFKEKNSLNKLVFKNPKPNANKSNINLFIKKDIINDNLNSNKNSLNSNNFENVENLKSQKNKIIKIKNKIFNLKSKEYNSENNIFLCWAKKKGLSKNKINIFNNNSNNKLINIFSRKNFFKKNLSNNFENLLNLNKNFVIPNLPEGKNLKIIIFENYGNKEFIGFSGIELFDDKGDLILILNENISSNSDNFNNLNNINNGIYLKGFDNQLFYTNLDVLPFEINIKLKNITKLSKIRIWNYNNPNKYDINIKNFSINFDNNLIFFGKLKESNPDLHNFNNIFFTNDNLIISRIIKKDWFEEIINKLQVKTKFNKIKNTFDSNISILNFGDNLYSITFEIVENYYEKNENVIINFQVKNKNNNILKIKCISKPNNCKFNKLNNDFYSICFLGCVDFTYKFSFLVECDSYIDSIIYKDNSTNIFTKILDMILIPPKSAKNHNIVKKRIKFNKNEQYKKINLSTFKKTNYNKVYEIINNIKCTNLKIDFHSNYGHNNTIGFDKINIYNSENKNIFDIIKYKNKESNFSNITNNWSSSINKDTNIISTYKLNFHKIVDISSIEFHNNFIDSSKFVKDYTIYANNFIIYQGTMIKYIENSDNITIINFDLDKTLKNQNYNNQSVKFINNDI